MPQAAGLEGGQRRPEGGHQDGVRRADGVIYGYAEHRYFRYDDDEMLMERLMVDLAMLHSVDDFGLRNERRAYEYWRTALSRPYPEGAQEDLAKIKPSLDGEMHTRLAPLMAS